MKNIILFITLFCSSFGWSQTFNFTFETQWVAHENRCIPCDYNEVNGEVISTITKQIKVRGNYEFTYNIENVKYETVELPSFYDKNVLPSEADLSVTFGESRQENFITLVYNPIVNRNGKIEMLKEIEISVSGAPNFESQNRDFDFASVSVLASGDWYKIGVSSDGVHKIDYSDLADMGVAVGSLNPNAINVYGNQIAELPHTNWAARPDDLLKNSIEVVGDGDGSFDTEDYALFYAKGPEKLIINSSDFYPRKNKIDSLNYYFIHIDNADIPKRIGTVNNSADPVNDEVTSYNSYALHENNNVNLLKSGDGWYGEHFEGSSLTSSFSINAENRVLSEPIFLETKFVCKSKSGSSGLIVNVNGAEVDNIAAGNVSGSYTVATNEGNSVDFNSGTENINVDLTFYRTSASAEAWLDYMEFNYIKKLQMGVNQLLIRDLRNVGSGVVKRYNMAGSNASTNVWEITDGINAKKVNGNLSGSNYTYIMDADTLRSFVAFNVAQTKSVIITGNYLGKIANQNLHGLPQADYVIVSHESLRSQADRLANLHRANGLSVHVVDIQTIYNEFSSGVSDPVAVRWFAKMFYDRVAVDPDNTLKYLCLFGDGTYDPLNRIANNNYLLPTYNSPESGPVDYISSFTADDFFGLLDDLESMSATDMLDIGIGRIPVSDLEKAEQVVDKIQHYMNYGSTLYSNTSGIQCDSDGYASTFGDWRNRIVLMADDENNGQFVSDCESLSDTTFKYHPEINVVKIYLDAYKQTVTSGGQRYPDVEEAINQNMNKGALVFNYVGHGGETGLSLERVVSIPMIQNWSNINNMPIFISATCEFSRFDDPGRVSAGETTLTTPYGGAVGLLTTTRLVYITVNTILVQNLYTELFSEEDGEPLGLGEIIRRTKNLTLGSNNMRNFTLLGDPALKLGKAGPRIMTDEINGVDVSMVTDTLKALSKITVTGHVENDAGTLLSGYNGLVYPTVFDKRKTRYTLGQDITSPVKPFDTQNNIIYKGKSTVKDGIFTFSFVVPKDIDYTFGKGKISYYGNTNDAQYYGFDSSIVVGGVNPDGISDDIGPEIELFMNDENFVSGGLTDTKPLFLASINDENGINTTGNGIGHNITLIIDGNTAAPIVLNNFYEADLDTYQSGKVSYRLSDLEEGPHQIVFKVWDVNNNSSEAVLDFIVVQEEEIGISHLLNYPNPFTTNTDFYFEHNQVCNSLDVKIEVFTVSGKLVKTIIETVHTAGFRSDGINWDGRDDYGDKIGRGVYVYRLSIETEQGNKAEKIEKLVIL
ncbi:MAG: type IX secretion system sortase PorU [Crocinitomix sp.]|nr:type IX secretion system sortase PorU [Crocinitomix sp.]